ncbi:hypothetical protein [Chryseobacterium sp. W4I1]|uniref:hypothetical protein n=1 Tax=Chryseobacterium sp. W4I1 TaxID=3042293 RepID=UPI00277E3B0A|nr:hypothetical protein [Chryseobacterium sp. W4I1]MDQ0783445.1 hypothetical protein [Chryseobacterium sp. W4I1]
MKKNFIFRLLPLIALAISLQSCRTSEDYLSGNEEPSYSNKFQVFSSANKEPVNYAQGFKTLLENYDQINGTNYTKASLLKKGNFKKGESEYVEFKLYSQQMLLDDGERWVVYPIIKNNQVDGLMVGILSNTETEVEFRKLNSGSSYYTEVIEIFRIAFMKNTLKKGLLNKGSGCGFEEDDACGIPDIIISPPPKNPKPTGGGPKGGCTGYNNCFDPSGGSGGGGGNNTPTPEPPVNPCEKLKAQNQNANFKAKVDNLKTKTNNSSESGYRVGSPPPGSGQTTTQYQELSNKPGTNKLDFKIFNTTYGIMHSHYDGLIPIFSPGDINLFIQLLQNAQTNNIPLSEVFLSVVTSQGVYQLRGDGIDVGSLSMYTDAQIETFNSIYSESMGNPNISATDLQKEFLKFMKVNMNIDGAKLYETDSDGSSKQLVLNGNNLSTPNCP